MNTLRQAPNARRRAWRSTTVGWIASAALVLLGATAYAEDDDKNAIRAFIAGQADAWNRHDATAYAALFSADADVVNIQGWWWRGRAELERKLTRAFAVVFRDSRLTITEVSIELLGPELAIAHVRWTMEGGQAPPGARNPPHIGIQLQVLRKEVGRWYVRAFQNTISLPEEPFPDKGD
jgi:uncharacterized protein (TIGR02246 family)